MGLPPHNAVNRPTPVPVPESRPVLEIHPTASRTVQVAFHDNAGLTKARPKGVTGAVIRWDILDEPPRTADSLTRSVFDTKSPYTFVFDEDQRKQTLYLAAAWQNTRGQQGPWSDIVSTVIP
jgi:hypothetical protein